MTYKLTVEECLLAISFYDDFYFARRFALKRPDILALIEIESGFDADAYREEPRLEDASYGLMQILFSTAYDRGYRGDPKGLLQPDINIHYGMAQVDWICDYLRTNGETRWERVIAAYNEGVGNVLKGRPDASYVDRWREARTRYIRFS